MQNDKASASTESADATDRLIALLETQLNQTETADQPTPSAPPSVEVTPTPTPAQPAATPPAAPAQNNNWAALPLRLQTTDADKSGFEPGLPIIQISRPAPISLDPAPPVKVEALEASFVTPIAPEPPLISLAPPLPIGRPMSAIAPATPPEPPAPAPNPILAQIEDGPETLSAAILSALEKNPEIQIAESQRDDALFGVDESRAALLPSVNLSASHGRERRTTQDEDEQSGLNTRTEITISLRQNVFDFGQAHETLRSSASVAESAEWGYRNQIDQVALRIAGTFHQLAERQNIVALAEQNLVAHEAILKTVQTQREFGLVTGSDVSRIETRLNAARSELLDRKSALDQAREDYRRLLNRAPGVVVAPEGVEDRIPPTVEAAIELLQDSNPQVMQARRMMESLEQQRAAQRAGGMPRFDLEVEGASRNNVGGETGRNEEARALLSMRMPLFDGGARQAAVSRLTARIRQSEFQVERTKRDAEQAIRNDYTALTAAKDKITTIEAEVTSAERLVALHQEQFKSGTRTVFDLLDSQQTLYTAKVKRESNRTEVRLSSYRVLGTLGSLVQTVTKADKLNVRLFPAAEPRHVTGGRPTSGY